MRGRGPSPFHGAPKSSRLERGGTLSSHQGCATFRPHGVAKLVRSTAACGEMGTPQPHQACAWLLAIFRKLAATWHT